jgi:hypothetical protein
VSRVNPRLVYWIAALYEKHEPKLTSKHQAILTCLATRHLNYEDGRGSCSTEQLMADNTASEATVRAALTRARQLSLLQQTRRGHRTGDGLSIASEWALIYPPISTAQERRVEKFSTAQKPLSQPLRTDGPTEKKQKTSRARASSAPRSQPKAQRRCPKCRFPVGADGTCGCPGVIHLQAAL